MLKALIGVGAFALVSVTLVSVGGIHIHINSNSPPQSSHIGATTTGAPTFGEGRIHTVVSSVKVGDRYRMVDETGNASWTTDWHPPGAKFRVGPGDVIEWL